MSTTNDTKGQHPDITQEKGQGAGDQANAATCGVCNEAPPKYKCPRCYLPYCSVACNKVHRENHPPDPEPTQKPIQPQASSGAASVATTPVNNPNNPFHALDSASDKLQMLFTKYPSLPQQLMDINHAMQPPSETPQNNGIPASLLKGLPNKRDGWNHDLGIKNGKEALRRARKADGASGEGVREYCELIRYLMNEQAGADASAMLQKQVATQDSELIERLMAEEKRR